MSEFLDRISKLSPQRLALLADELNERLQASERRRKVPLAIVGIGCRLPGGVNDPEGFWKLLSEGVDAVGEVPPSRWDVDEFYDRNPDTPGKMATRWGGFIEDVDQFDPKFFGIAPAEADSMDPQQRLLLETTWEALEHAGIAPTALAGTQTGVFVGICNGDYSQVALDAPRETITPYFAPGLSHAVAAGRISYVLGLHGPSLVVDTSCSASLVAVHLACQSLRLGESDVALTGGVNLILNQDITIALSQSKMMAPDGRCKAFSESANGFVRGEGCGMIVLKRLPDAIRDRNRILAVIRGSACNQDGRSSGLTAPNGPSQEAVVATALADAGLQPDDVDAIEAHGTGTALGDPIEAGALNAVFASRSSESEPLYVGSVKTNLGHLESAAGIAGLIKLVLSIQCGKIPASLHFEKPNSRIEWDRLPMKVPTQLQTWNRRSEKRVGGVSSFGFSGTNAHVIVEEYLDNAQLRSIEDRPFLFTLSAKTETALKSIAVRLHHYLADHSPIPLADVARTLNTGRSHFEYRAGMTTGSHEELLKLLNSFQKSGDLRAIQAGRAVTHSPRVAFVFDGAQSYGGDFFRELYDLVPAFRKSLLRCEKLLIDDLEKPLTSVLYPEAGAGLGDRKQSGIGNLPSAYKKAAEFALQYALAEVWRSCGIEPSTLLGVGVGEYVAACIAGIFNLEDGLHLAIADDGRNSAEFNERAKSVSYHQPQIQLITNLNADVCDGSSANSAEYWLRRSHSNTASSSALSALAKEGCAANMYIGDSSGLAEFAKSDGNNLPEKWLASLGEGQSDCRQFLNAAASLYVLGCDLDMSGFYRDAANTVSLPTYPFERERYWLESANSDKNGRRDTARRAELELPVATDEWIYDLVWEPKPLSSKTRRKTVRGLNPGMVERLVVPRANDELMYYAGLSSRLDSVCAAYIARALLKIGAGSLPQRNFTLPELCQQLEISNPRRPLFERLLTILSEDGHVERIGNQFHFTNFLETSAVEGELEKLQRVYPECRIEIDVLRRCAENLAGVLLGTVNPVHLLFPDNSMEEAEHIYRHSPIARFYNDAVGDIVQEVVKQAAGRTLRILEIGGGTGSTTASILPQIAGNDVEYLFTDISSAFVSRARSKFSGFPSLKYQVLDIERDPAQQSVQPASYDIVIAANVLHATADLRRTISHAQKLLAPGGLLLLLEGIRPERSVDLTFGLTDGWWRFADTDLRPDYPLVAADTWTRLLREAGMVSTRTMSYPPVADSVSQQMLILAQASADEMLPTPSGGKPVCRWIILADESGVGAALDTLLTNSGEQCTVLHRPHSASELGTAFTKLQNQPGDETTIEVIYLWSVDAAETICSANVLAEEAEVCGKTLIHLIQILLAPENHTMHLWVATRGAQPTESFSPGVGGAAQSTAWGVGRVLGLEAPEQYRALIDLDPAQTPEAGARSLLEELLADDVEDQIAYRDGQRLVARLKNSSLKNSTAETSAGGIHRDGSYLLVGGLGGLGLRLAKWVAEQRPGRLILLGRTGIGNNAGAFLAERLSAIEEIEKLGVDVTVVEGDVASEADMTRLFGRFGNEFPPLRGVFHAATAIHGAELSDLTDEQIETMLRPKVLGMCVLHELTKNLNLDFFLAFSSAASLLGAKGLAHYAAANQFLDSFAHYRRAVGLPMLAVNWGAWDVMRLASLQGQSRFSETGLLPMSSYKLLNIFPELIASRRAQIMIANVDWNVLKPVLEANRVRPMLDGFDNGRSKPARASATPVPAPASLYAAVGMPPEDRRKFIEAFVLEQTARVLGFRGGDFPSADVPLTDIGLDSLMAVDLKHRLQTGLGQELSPTIVFDYPTVSGMVGMLETMLWAAHGDAEDNFASSQKDEIRI